MSWFSAQSIKGLTEKVQSALPKIDPEMIEKLTLTTPELTAERQRIDQEERRKEHVRDMLAGMLPWETRDPERDILVDECKEAILQLSSDRKTFYGPYPMPGKKIKLGKSKETGEEQEQEEEAHDAENEPPSESLEKLAKLEPLPVLLQEFDLDAHVGLINRLLKEDPKLVEMQSHLSGGGERERIFWRNYFFHCAYTRYEAGLSIDEIWSDQPPANTTSDGAVSESEGQPVEAAAAAAPEEETITFDSDGHAEQAPPEKAFPCEPATDADAPFTKEASKDVSSAPTSEGVDFEMVAESDAAEVVTGDDDNLADYELDELEAEIAKELED